jgi:hypothetical protein
MCSSRLIWYTADIVDRFSHMVGWVMRKNITSKDT